MFVGLSSSFLTAEGYIILIILVSVIFPLVKQTSQSLRVRRWKYVESKGHEFREGQSKLMSTVGFAWAYLFTVHHFMILVS